MLLKTEFKTQHKMVLNSKSDHFSSSSDSDLDSIISFFVRDIRKRLKRINIFLNQNTFNSRPFISLTIFISSSSILLTAFISSLFILSNQSIFKLMSFTSLIFINIIRKQIKVVFFKTRLNKRIFERDFLYYNKALNKASR